MARFTQYHGLTEEARKFLADAELVTHFEGTLGIAMEPIHFGIWKKKDKKEEDDYFPQMEGTYAEIVQAEIWSSGPMIFTCLIDLRHPDKRLFEWSEAEMKKY